LSSAPLFDGTPAEPRQKGRRRARQLDLRVECICGTERLDGDRRWQIKKTADCGGF
jgi:hypothetical protein